MFRGPLLCFTHIFILASLLGSLPFRASAQDEAWLRQNQQKDPLRYEGLIDQPNARAEYAVMEFLGFAGEIPARIFPANPPALHVHFCQPGGAQGQAKAYLEVRQISGHVNYLMKAVPGVPASTSNRWVDFSWPTAAVIAKYGIDANKLGVVLHAGENSEYSTNLIPAAFSSSGSAPAGPINAYRLTLRIQQNSLEALSYQIHPEHGEPITCFYENDLHPCATKKPSLQSPIETGSMVRLLLQLPDADAGPVTVQVKGRYLNSDDILSANFHFNHEPRCQ